MRNLIHGNLHQILTVDDKMHCGQIVLFRIEYIGERYGHPVSGFLIAFTAH